MALGRSLVIGLDPDREIQLDEMNRPKRSRPFAYPDLLMAGIAYLHDRKGVCITEEITDNMLGKDVKDPDHVAIRRWACTRPSPWRVTASP